MKKFSILLVTLVIVAIVFAVAITRDGKLVTPEGSGSVTLGSDRFEAFPLPDYAARTVTENYKSYFVEVDPGIKMHVLEVGSGYPLYLQHGNPTSGFLYRKVAELLPKDRVRVIMPTLIGLGFSSKVPASEHTLDNHIFWLSKLLKQLNLTELIYVGQDWGGPTGMGALAQAPGLLKGAVILNTGFNAPTGPMELSPAHTAVRTPVVGELLTGVIASIFERLPDMQGDPSSIPKSVQQLYGRPVLDSGNSKAPLAMMRMVPDGTDHPSVPAQRDIEKYVNGLNIPAEIIWGMNDPILANGLAAMKQNFPNAPVTETEAGHFLQEEIPGEISAALMRVLEQVRSNREQNTTVPAAE
ncbi:MAG: alpha/beta fold hydrolase [Pseudomonadota bacterium]